MSITLVIFDLIQIAPGSIKPVFDSSREFFYTTIPNVNYGMTDADFQKITQKTK